MNIRTWVIARKELLQLRRDRMTLAMMLVLPVMQLLLFGYAINTDVRHIPAIIYDQDQSAASRDLAASLEATRFYDIVGNARNYAEVEHALRAGTAHVALVVPAKYSSSITRGEIAELQLIVDGSDPQTVASATNTAASLVAARSGRLMVARLAKTGGGAPFEPISLQTTTWYNPDLRTAVYIVPGLVGVILTMTMVMLTSMAIARERERGTLEQLIVSPIKKIELIVGKILPYIVIGYAQMTLILLAGRVVFDVPLVGSCPFCTPSHSCSSPRTSPWACSFRPSRAPNSRRCRCRSSSSCRTFCSPDSCSPSRRCHAPPSGSPKPFRSPIFCGSCAGSRYAARGFRISAASSGS